MTNRILDADALLRWVKATKGLFDDETLDDFYLSTIEKINELSLDVPKQYVDVNVLKSQLLKITFPRQYGHMPYYKQIMDKIQSVIGSIATPAFEPQETFDADGWGSMYDVPKNIEIEVMVNNQAIIKAKFDADLNICTDYDVNKIKVLNKWRPLPTLPKI